MGRGLVLFGLIALFSFWNETLQAEDLTTRVEELPPGAFSFAFDETFRLRRGSEDFPNRPVQFRFRNPQPQNRDDRIVTASCWLRSSQEAWPDVTPNTRFEYAGCAAAASDNEAAAAPPWMVQPRAGANAGTAVSRRPRYVYRFLVRASGREQRFEIGCNRELTLQAFARVRRHADLVRGTGPTTVTQERPPLSGAKALDRDPVVMGRTDGPQKCATPEAEPSEWIRSARTSAENAKICEEVAMGLRDRILREGGYGALVSEYRRWDWDNRASFRRLADALNPMLFRDEARELQLFRTLASESGVTQAQAIGGDESATARSRFEWTTDRTQNFLSMDQTQRTISYSRFLATARPIQDGRDFRVLGLSVRRGLLRGHEYQTLWVSFERNQLTGPPGIFNPSSDVSLPLFMAIKDHFPDAGPCRSLSTEDERRLSNLINSIETTSQQTRPVPESARPRPPAD